MKKILVIFLLLTAIYNLNGQSLIGEHYLFEVINPLNSSEIGESLFINHTRFTDGNPDSTVYFEGEDNSNPSIISSYVYQDDKITNVVRRIEGGKWINNMKIEYFMDINSPKLIYDSPYNSIKYNINNELIYYYRGTIGDTLSITYYWNSMENIWVENYKTNHFISPGGVDTLSITNIWDTINNKWIENSKVTHQYYNGDIDTLKFKMTSLDNNRILADEVFTYKSVNSSTKTILSYDIDFYPPYFSIDSIIYNLDNKIEFMYRGYNEGIDQKRQYSYNTEQDISKIKFWRKDPRATDWIFSGTLVYYYPYSITTYQPEISICENQIYPIPSNKEIYLKGYQGMISIFNSSGIQVKVEKTDESNPVVIEDLPIGAYFIKLENGTAAKFIKN